MPRMLSRGDVRPFPARQPPLGATRRGLSVSGNRRSSRAVGRPGNIALPTDARPPTRLNPTSSQPRTGRRAGLEVAVFYRIADLTLTSPPPLRLVRLLGGGGGGGGFTYWPRSGQIPCAARGGTFCAAVRGWCVYGFCPLRRRDETEATAVTAVSVCPLSSSVQLCPAAMSARLSAACRRIGLPSAVGSLLALQRCNCQTSVYPVLSRRHRGFITSTAGGGIRRCVGGDSAAVAERTTAAGRARLCAMTSSARRRRRCSHHYRPGQAGSAVMISH